MISRKAATKIAQDKLDAISCNSGVKMVLLDIKQLKKPAGWLFLYNSEKFSKTKSPIDMLAGNGPLLVRADGSIDVLPSSKNWKNLVQVHG